MKLHTKSCIFVILTGVVFLLCGCRSSNETVLQGLEADEETALAEEGEDAFAQDFTEAEPERQKSSIFVYICGAVSTPGVYEMPEGSRLYELIEKAGGFSPQAAADYLNLAELIADGSRVRVPTEEEVELAENEGLVLLQDGSSVLPGTGDAKGQSSNSQDDGLVNINTADVEQLCTLSGVGKSRAEAIIAYRQEFGSFEKKEDIMKVAGIKEGLYSKIKDRIKVQ